MFGKTYLKLHIDKAFKKVSIFFGKYIFVYTKIFKNYATVSKVIKVPYKIIKRDIKKLCLII